MSTTRTLCPICGVTVHDLERVEARHTPASVPEHAKGYDVVQRFTLVECEKGHRYQASGGKGPMGWRELRSTAMNGAWNAA